MIQVRMKSYRRAQRKRRRKRVRERELEDRKRETDKSAGVVVPDSLGIAKRLQQRIGLQNHFFDSLKGGGRGRERGRMGEILTAKALTLHIDSEKGEGLLTVAI